jgi:hypothetical protein
VRPIHRIDQEIRAANRDELATALRKPRKLLPTMSVYEVETRSTFFIEDYRQWLDAQAGMLNRFELPIRLERGRGRDQSRQD